MFAPKNLCYKTVQNIYSRSLRMDIFTRRISGRTHLQSERRKLSTKNFTVCTRCIIFVHYRRLKGRRNVHKVGIGNQQWKRPKRMSRRRSGIILKVEFRCEHRSWNSERDWNCLAYGLMSRFRFSTAVNIWTTQEDRFSYQLISCTMFSTNSLKYNVSWKD